MAETRHRVAIVGGGIAGLTAAWRLHQRGIDFALIEASPRLGGVIRSETAQGFLLEAGPDAILAQKAEGLALCRELGLDSRLIPTNPAQRSVYILNRGRMHAMPDGLVLTIPTRILPFARASLFSWRAKLRMGLEVFVPARRDGADESIASFMLRRFGREALDLLGEPLLAGIHSGDPERLSMRATFPRFVEMEERHGSLIRAMLAARPRRPSAGSGSAFYSLAGGLEELVGALAARLPAGAVRRNARVRALRHQDGMFALDVADGQPLLADTVIVAAPAHAAAPLLVTLSPQLSQALQEIRFVSTAVVFLGYRREDVRHALDGYGLLLPRRERLRTAAMTFFSTKYPGRAPQDHVLVRGFLGGAQDSEILDLDDAALVGTVKREAGSLLGIRGEPVLVRVYRWPLGTPQMEVGHFQRMAAVERLRSEVPGLFLTGAGLRTTGIPDGIADASLVAGMAAGFLG
jgi:oxygen-dependent protoporphyrinogen oxidase